MLKTDPIMFHVWSHKHPPFISSYSHLKIRSQINKTPYKSQAKSVTYNQYEKCYAYKICLCTDHGTNFENGKEAQRLWSGSEEFGTFLLLDCKAWNELIVRCCFWVGVAWFKLTTLVSSSPFILFGAAISSSSSKQATAIIPRSFIPTAAGGHLKNRIGGDTGECMNG